MHKENKLSPNGLKLLFVCNPVQIHLNVKSHQQTSLAVILLQTRLFIIPRCGDGVGQSGMGLHDGDASGNGIPRPPASINTRSILSQQTEYVSMAACRMPSQSRTALAKGAPYHPLSLYLPWSPSCTE